jgi:hypothetical protein
MGRVGQVVVLVCRFWPVFSDFIKVIAAVAEIEQIPVVMVAPILHVLATEVGEWMVRPLWRKELARSARCEWYLGAAEADVPVDVVFKNQGSLESRIQEPAGANQWLLSDMGLRRGTYQRRALWWPNHASIEPRWTLL